MIRIIGGEFKRQKLEWPMGEISLRPTKDMVREALFSILQTRLNGASFLDLFAGVGAVGLEAISRGCASAVFIDKDTNYVVKNVNKLGCMDRAEIYRNDSLRALDILQSKGTKFDLIFIDPPYNTDLVERSLNKIFCSDILKSNGLVVVESLFKQKFVSPFSKVFADKKYGQTRIVIYERD